MAADGYRAASGRGEGAVLVVLRGLRGCVFGFAGGAGCRNGFC